MTKATKPAEVGPWAKEKLEALERYLNYYTTVLKNQRWRTLYVDAFAGGGTAKVRQKARADTGQTPLLEDIIDPEQEEFIRGSPRIALGLKNPFDTYVFIDASGARIAELEALRAEYGNRRNIHIRPGLAEDELGWVLKQNVSVDTHRGVAFLDPFGAHVGWSSVAALAETRLFEVLVNFPLHMALARLMKNDADIPTNWRAQLDHFFGSADWVDDVYETREDLLGRSTGKRDNYLDRLRERYRGQLRDAFGFVSVPKRITNTRGAPLYYLLWAGPHRKGLQGADYILRMGERGLLSKGRSGRDQ
jgi:three-Cys-motif partner protein